jgi:hypothetical protein
VPAEAAPPTAATSSVDGLLSEDHLKSLLASPVATDVCMYGNVTEGLVSRSVDFDTTPQQINYTGSTSQTFSNNSSIGGGVAVSSNFMVSGIDTAAPPSLGLVGTNVMFNASPASPFQPTQKELLSATQVIETAETDDLPRKRGRKPSKKR